jgi:hypothetical protein
MIGDAWLCLHGNEEAYFFSNTEENAKFTHAVFRNPRPGTALFTEASGHGTSMLLGATKPENTPTARYILVEQFSGRIL